MRRFFRAQTGDDERREMGEHLQLHQYLLFIAKKIYLHHYRLLLHLDFFRQIPIIKLQHDPVNKINVLASRAY